MFIEQSQFRVDLASECVCITLASSFQIPCNGFGISSNAADSKTALALQWAKALA